MDPILKGLDAEQRAAVTAPAELLCVVAGPGSGKTRVLTHRIAYRCKNGTADASHVLAATFSRRAARELRQRLYRLGVGNDVVAGTFHGLGLTQLKRHARDNDRSLPRLMQGRQRLLSSLAPGLESAIVRSVSAEIDWAQAQCVAPDHYPERAEAANRQPRAPLGQIAEIATLYSETKRNRRLYDFNDLLAQWTTLLHSDPVFSAAQRWRFRHLFIDEMQDLTPRQIALVSALLGESHDAFLVGDPDQAIYGFAGANSEPGLTKEFPGIRYLALTANHRCSPQIVETSNALASIPHRSTRPAGPRVTRYEVTGSAGPLVQCVVSAHDLNTDWNDIAVLARNNTQVNDAAELLEAAGVPVSVRRNASLIDAQGIDAALRSLSTLDKLDDVFDALPRLGLDPRALKDLTRLIEDFRAADSGASPTGLRSWMRMDASVSVKSDGVQLATFHASKGLEWPAVVLHDVVTAGPEPEERRLLFVAMTRAIRMLTILSHRAEDDWLADLKYSDSAAVDTAASAWQQEVQRGRSLLVAGTDPLFSAIVKWRDQVAHAARITPSAVLTKERARLVAERRPSNTEELAEIAGWGPAVESRLAPGLLAILGQSANSSTTDV